jgi:hypothetical protein
LAAEKPDPLRSGLFGRFGHAHNAQTQAAPKAVKLPAKQRTVCGARIEEEQNMSDIRPPSWLELESVLPLEAEAGVTSVETVTTLSAETQRREYPEFIIQLSPRRQGMKLKHALRIAGTADIEANPASAQHERTKLAT